MLTISQLRLFSIPLPLFGRVWIVDKGRVLSPGLDLNHDATIDPVTNSFIHPAVHYDATHTRSATISH